ncbi:hypothetical protein ACFWCA_43695 [Streptomyces phaeochromogenes]
MTNSDKLLERLVKRVNDNGVFLDITITISGSLITGRLAPRGAWLATIAEELESSDSPDFANDFKAEAGALDTTEYVHLSGGRVLHGTISLPTKGGLFRAPVSSVEAWTIGRIG